jgi:hypothetical protein
MIDKDFIKQLNLKIIKLKDRPTTVLKFMEMCGIQLFRNSNDFIEWLTKERYILDWNLSKDSSIKKLSLMSHYSVDMEKNEINYTYKGNKYNKKLINIKDYIKIRYENINPEHYNLIMCIYVLDENFKTAQIDSLVFDN